jgi:hypothetical protein
MAVASLNSVETVTNPECGWAPLAFDRMEAEILRIAGIARGNDQRRTQIGAAPFRLDREFASHCPADLAPHQDRIAVKREALLGRLVALLELQCSAGNRRRDPFTAAVLFRTPNLTRRRADTVAIADAQLDVVRTVADLADPDALRHRSVALVDDDRTAESPKRLTAEVQTAVAKHPEIKFTVERRCGLCARWTSGKCDGCDAAEQSGLSFHRHSPRIGVDIMLAADLIAMQLQAES